MRDGCRVACCRVFPNLGWPKRRRRGRGDRDCSAWPVCVLFEHVSESGNIGIRHTVVILLLRAQAGVNEAPPGFSKNTSTAINQPWTLVFVRNFHPPFRAHGAGLVDAYLWLVSSLPTPSNTYDTNRRTGSCSGR